MVTVESKVDNCLLIYIVINTFLVIRQILGTLQCARHCILKVIVFDPCSSPGIA